MIGKPKLIVFDVEGVLIPKNRFIYEVAKRQPNKFLKILFFGFLYEIAFIHLESALKQIYGSLKGVKIEVLISAFEKIPVVPNLKYFIEQLKLRGYKIALVSSGLPGFLVAKLCASIGADYNYGIDVDLSDGELTGEISGDAVKTSGKLVILTKILAAERLTLSDCIVVADDRNNKCILLPEVQKIGYNPDFIVRVKADVVVTGRFSNVLPAIEGKHVKRPFPSRNDFVREDIHASGIFVPVIAGIIGAPIVAILILSVAIIYAISELLRLDGKNLPIISAITHLAASPSELSGFAAAPLYFAFGITLTLLVFPAPASSAAIAIFALGDSAASLFGGLLGKRLPFNKDKTLEGSFAGFIFAFLAGSLFVPPLFALVGAVVAMVVEYLPLPLNDNVMIPIVTGLVLSFLV